MTQALNFGRSHGQELSMFEYLLVLSLAATPLDMELEKRCPERSPTSCTCEALFGKKPLGTFTPEHRALKWFQAGCGSLPATVPSLGSCEPVRQQLNGCDQKMQQAERRVQQAKKTKPVSQAKIAEAQAALEREKLSVGYTRGQLMRCLASSQLDGGAK